VDLQHKACIMLQTTLASMYMAVCAAMHGDRSNAALNG
jgi:hypothetical protein